MHQNKMLQVISLFLISLIIIGCQTTVEKKPQPNLIIRSNSFESMRLTFENIIEKNQGFPMYAQLAPHFYEAGSNSNITAHRINARSLFADVIISKMKGEEVDIDSSYQQYYRLLKRYSENNQTVGLRRMKHRLVIKKTDIARFETLLKDNQRLSHDLVLGKDSPDGVHIEVKMVSKETMPSPQVYLSMLEAADFEPIPVYIDDFAQLDDELIKAWAMNQALADIIREDIKNVKMSTYYGERLKSLYQLFLWANEAYELQPAVHTGKYFETAQVGSLINHDGSITDSARTKLRLHGVVLDDPSWSIGSSEKHWHIKDHNTVVAHMRHTGKHILVSPR